MAFMTPEVTGKQQWAGVETTAGFWWVPIDVLSTSETESAKRGDFEPLLKYTEGSKVYSDQSSLKKGYGVRLSARGYMDATDWEVYGNKKEAVRRARELAREAEGEDYATMKKPRGHATKKKSPPKTWHIFETARATGDRWVAGPYMTKKRAEELTRRYMTDPPGPDSLRRSGVYIVKDHGL